MPDTPRTIVILGPTASGKSDLAIQLAQQHSGEIISADSRQVYRGMDIGSGKVARDPRRQPEPDEGYYSDGILHHLLDVADPKAEYNVTDFLRDAEAAEKAIRKRGHVPIIAGGTGFWVQTYIEKQSFPGVPPNPELRAELMARPVAELYAELQAKDPARAKTIDRKNPVRLVRALEIVAVLGKVPEAGQPKIRQEDYLLIALDPGREAIKRNIQVRLRERFKAGMVQEVERLQHAGVSWKRLESFGLEYKYIALFLQKKLKRAEMEQLLFQEIARYAKRQITWLRRMEQLGWKIHWIKRAEEAEKVLLHA